MAIITLNAANFEGTIESGLTLVDFWAEWCAPCRMLAPVLEEVASLENQTAKVGKVNVDNDQALASRYNIRGIPTMILFKDGQPVDQIVGLTDKAGIEALIKKNS
jgi:thioredoxin 1